MVLDGDIGEHLILGTAQMGMNYGIGNRTGRPSDGEIRAIVAAAWGAGIRKFDTAQAYGDSEVVLGQALHYLKLSEKARIVTKIDTPADPTDKKKLRKTITESLNRLGVSRLHGLMWHREQVLDLLSEELQATMADFIEEGILEHWGVSLYTPARALQAIDAGVFDLLQVPANVLDRRFETVGVFDRAEERGMQIHVRSVFLQGLLLMEIEAIPEAMNFSLPVLNLFKEICAEMDRPRHEIALQYIKSRFPGARVIMGAETTQQVRENVNAWSGIMTDSWMKRIEEAFAGVGESVVDPTKWSMQ